jgi:hypothetical protein
MYCPLSLPPSPPLSFSSFLPFAEVQLYFAFSSLRWGFILLWFIILLDKTIDYRCEKKKLLSWDNILVSLRSWRLQGSEKCRSLTLSKHLFIRKLKKTILHRLSIPNPNFSEFAFFGKQICRLGIVDFNLPSNWWVSLLQKSEFAVLVLGFEKLGLELDNCGRTTKNAYCRIYSLCCEPVVTCACLHVNWNFLFYLGTLALLTLFFFFCTVS